MFKCLPPRGPLVVQWKEAYYFGENGLLMWRVLKLPIDFLVNCHANVTYSPFHLALPSSGHYIYLGLICMLDIFANIPLFHTVLELRT